MTNPEIHLQLARLDDFFAAPPFDWREPQSQLHSGCTLALSRLEKHPKALSPRLVLGVKTLPTQEEESRFRAAFASFCTQQAQTQTRLAGDIRKKGWRALRLGLVALALALSLSTAISQIGPFPNLLNEMLSEGLIIVGWVVLWHPLEMLLYESSVHQRMARLYTRLSRCALSFTPL